jgi:prepilin-type N-terminal cleavage/methylation domain-containing protein
VLIARPIGSGRARWQHHPGHQHSVEERAALDRKSRVFGLFAGFFRYRSRTTVRYKRRVSKGFTLLELLTVVCIAAILATFGIPRAARWLDWLATQAALRDVTTALAVGRSGAVMQAVRARVVIAADTLRIDRLEAQQWVPWWRTPGPAARGVTLVVSNPTITFGPTGMGWGASNTTIRLSRGSHVETVTVSRVGRVKLW